MLRSQDKSKSVRFFLLITSKLTPDAEIFYYLYI